MEMEKFYSRKAYENAKDDHEREELLDLAREEAKKMNDDLMRQEKAEEMEKEHRTLDDKEILGGLEGPIGDDEVQGTMDDTGTPLSPDEEKGLDDKKKEE